MKKILIGVGIFLLLGLWAWKSESPKQQFGSSQNIGYSYTSPTSATSSVTTSWTASPVVSADSSRGFVSFCNDNGTATNAIYLGLGATTTGVSGLKIPGNSCYEMTLQKMFTGNIYAIASPTAATLLIIYK